MSELQSQIESLSAAEKFELLDALWESLETEDPETTEAQASELDRRIDRYRQDPARAISWEQVQAELFKKH